MYNSDQIKKRFKAGIVIDRHGFELDQDGDRQESTIFLRLAHYRLIDGMSKRAVKEKLIEFECSPFEADIVIEECMSFIEDVLEFDLNRHLKEANSTIGQCNHLLMEVTEKVNAWYREQIYLPIEFMGHTYDADRNARDALSNVITTATTPKYWTDTNNENVGDWTLTRTKQLFAAITQRDVEYHDKVANLKREMRMACENLEIIKLQQFSLPE